MSIAVFRESPVWSLSRDDWPPRVASMQRRADMVHERFAEYTSGHAVGDTIRSVRLRCDAPHKSARSRGKAPTLARVFLDSHGYLFTSRIQWLAGDFHRQPHWDYESLLLGIDLFTASTASLSRSRLFDYHEWSPANIETPRWLVGQTDTYIREVLEIGGGGARTLWVRCPDCRLAKAYDRERLLSAIRSAG